MSERMYRIGDLFWDYQNNCPTLMVIGLLPDEQYQVVREFSHTIEKGWDIGVGRPLTFEKNDLNGWPGSLVNILESPHFVHNRGMELHHYLDKVLSETGLHQEMKHPDYEYAFLDVTLHPLIRHGQESKSFETIEVAIRTMQLNGGWGLNPGLPPLLLKEGVPSGRYRVELMRLKGDPQKDAVTLVISDGGSSDEVVNVFSTT